MSHPVLALGAAALTAAGSAWYVPALADLRAGADRPASHRAAALACLTGWSTAAAVGVLLLLTESWWPPCAAASVGAAAATGLWARAVAHRRRGAREAALLWARLGRPAPVGRSGAAFVAAVLAGGLVTATATAAVLWAHGREAAPLWLTAATPLTLVTLALGLALTAAHGTGTPARPARRAGGRHDVPGR
ncbi:hypothetical protein [Streptomyces sp. NPDC087512]|uniref:hypothetical protein n=1 Tax=unclassified Streptomyces TaxID=2593676 RepID=UPI00344A36D9